MKNQYFGDLHDYRKYGLLRCLLEDTDLSCLVAWMLTPDDGSSDGLTHEQLARKESLAVHDPPLYRLLVDLLRDSARREVQLLEQTDLLGRVRYFSDLVPDDLEGREEWFGRLRATAADVDLVFLDPDNGIEVRSVPYGRKKSSKYVYWPEIAFLWNAGASLLIYQHFPRRSREEYIAELRAQLEEQVEAAKVVAFATSQVLFLLAVQPRHAELVPTWKRRIEDRWAGQVRVVESGVELSAAPVPVPDCPLCGSEPDGWIASLGEARAKLDAYPVTPGHTLVVPRRHVGSYFDLHKEERRDLWDLVDDIRRRLQGEHVPDGFNIGINIGEAAGQTIDHVHIHVIPRYRGDVEDPTGGVRGVIPAEQNYRKQDEH